MSTDLTSAEVEDLKFACYLGLLLMPRVFVKLAALMEEKSSLSGKDKSTMEYGVLSGMFHTLPVDLVARFPVLEKLLMEKGLSLRVVENLVALQLRDTDTDFDMRTLESLNAPFGKAELVAIAKEAIDELRAQVAEQHAADETTVHIYVDGSCLGNPGPGGVGVVWQTAGKTSEVAEPLEGTTTNSRAELSAVALALDELADGEKLRKLKLYTDSQYVVNMVVKKYRAAANKQLVAYVRERVEALDVDIIKVPGHDRVWANERADELAREAAAQAKETLRQAQDPSTC